MTADGGGGPRIAPATTRSEAGWTAWVVSRASGWVTGTNPPNLFLTLARNPRLFRGWLRFASRLMPGGRLPRRETELVILRVAHLRGCAYELEHHRRLGRRAGITDADLARVAEGPAAEGWTERERALLTAADELVRERDLTDGTWQALTRHLDTPRVIELVLLVTHYDMLATTIGALRVEPDREISRRRPPRPRGRRRRR